MQTYTLCDTNIATVETPTNLKAAFENIIVSVICESLR
jgi:hypothetical protein